MKPTLADDGVVFLQNSFSGHCRHLKWCEGRIKVITILYIAPCVQNEDHSMLRQCEENRQRTVVCPRGQKSTILWLEIHGKFTQWNSPFKPTFPSSPALSIPFWDYIGYLRSLVRFTLPSSNPSLSLSPFRPSLPSIPPQLTTIPHHFFFHLISFSILKTNCTLFFPWSSSSPSLFEPLLPLNHKSFSYPSENFPYDLHFSTTFLVSSSLLPRFVAFRLFFSLN